jgi:serine/threonine protein kinase
MLTTDTACRRPAPRPCTGSTGARSPLPSGRGEAGALLADRYRLTEVLGRGATARVWRAHDELRDRDVAIKQFHRPQTQDVAEARIAARIRTRTSSLWTRSCRAGTW